MSESRKELKASARFRPFVPHPLLANGHLMTVVPGFLPRNFSRFKAHGKARLFEVSNVAKLLGYCHFQSEKHVKRRGPLVIVLHGLEGSSESSHVLGIGQKAYKHGFNVVRLNMRNCGGSMKHSQTLYNAGMYHDLHAVMNILHVEEGFDEFIFAGYSLGGNLMLNAAIEHEGKQKIRAVCTVSPAIDLDHAVRSIEQPQNRLYQDWFLRTLKQKLSAKTKQFPEIYKAAELEKVSTIRDFDDSFTAPYGGYGNAERYYSQASTKGKIGKLSVPTLIIAAKDDPLVPVDTFEKLNQQNPLLDLLITEFGGHCGFFQQDRERHSGFDHYWAENRIIEFIKEVSRD